jgi:predicted PurR-regulated permease PerM
MSGEHQRDRIVWALVFALVALLGAGYFLTHTFSALLTSLVLAYLINPLLNYVEKRGFDRITSLVLLYAIAALVAFVASFALIPYLGHQIDAFTTALPVYIRTLQGGLERWRFALSGYYGGEEGAWLLEKTEQAMNQLNEALSGIGYQQVKKVLFAAFNLVLSPIMVFFMLLYKESAKDFIKRMFHHRERQHLLELGRDINHTLERFLVGMFFDCLIVGILTSVALALLGIEFPVLNGMFAGFASIVPFLGAVVSVIPPALIGYAKSGDLWIIPKVCGVYFLINVIIEGNLVKPLVMRHTLRLNPLGVIFAVMALGELLGFWGIVLAIPAAAVVKICTAEMHAILVQSHVVDGGRD